MSGLQAIANSLARALTEAGTRDAPDIEAVRASIFAKLQATMSGEDVPPPVRESADGMGCAVDMAAIRETLGRSLIPEDYIDVGYADEDETDQGAQIAS